MKLSLIDEKAQWREQFPVDLADDEYRSRRDFTRLLGLTSLAFVVGQVWIVARSVSHKVKSLWPRLAVSRVGDLPVGGTKVFHYPGENDPCVLVRLTKDNWVAYGQKCTHLSCPVIPQPERGRIFCPCHEGVFNIETGAPVSGPPRRPLVRVTLNVADNQVYATGVEGGEV
jgi:Rieske Fe-S protein